MDMHICIWLILKEAAAAAVLQLRLSCVIGGIEIQPPERERERVLKTA